MDIDQKKHKKDKGKKLSVGLRLILRPHTDESGSAGKKNRISSVQSSRMLHRHVGNPLHHLASGQQKLNDWWRLCYIKTASLANTLKQLVCHVENHESHVLPVAVLDKHALCRSRPSKWCVQRNAPGLRFKPYPLYICFIWWACKHKKAPNHSTNHNTAIMTGIHTETSIPLQSTQADRLLCRKPFKRKVKYLSPSNRIAFSLNCIASAVPPGSTLTSIISKLPEWVCLFTCDRCRARAVVQDRQLSEHLSRPDGA